MSTETLPQMVSTKDEVVRALTTGPLADLPGNTKCFLSKEAAGNGLHAALRAVEAIPYPDGAGVAIVLDPEL